MSKKKSNKNNKHKKVNNTTSNFPKEIKKEAVLETKPNLKSEYIISFVLLICLIAFSYCAIYISSYKYINLIVTLSFLIYFIIVAVTVLIVFAVSLLKENNINVRGEIAKRHILVRWLVYYAIIMFIIIFGAYGRGYTPVDPIYANF